VLEFPTLAVAISASSIVAVGAAVQGAVGLIDPHLVPGPMVFASMLLVLLTIWRDRAGIHLAGVGWSVVGRLPGTVLGALAVGAISASQMTLTIGLIVLLAVAISIWGPKLRPTPYTLTGAGMLSGLMGTVSSIGGPPIALVYQHESGPRLRGTLASFFLIGGVMTLVALHFVGRFGVPELLGAAALLPGVLVGFAFSSRIAPIIDRGYTRIAVLATSSAAALILLIRQF